MASHEKQRHINVVEVENLKCAVNNLEKRSSKAELLEGKANSENKELKGKIKSLERELIHANKEYSVQLQKAHELENKLSGSKGELKQLQMLSVNYKNECSQVQKQIVRHKEQMVRLEEEIKRLKGRKLKSMVGESG